MTHISSKEIPELIGSTIRYIAKGMSSCGKLFIVIDYNKNNNETTIYDIKENKICQPYYFPKAYGYWELI